MDFATSTHKRKWMFTKPDLDALRQRLNQASMEAVQRLRDAADPDQPELGSSSKRRKVLSPVSVEEEQKVLRFYQANIKELCDKELKLPGKVKATALVYFKRFFLAHSTLDYEPAKIMATSIYLACKTEEHYLSADRLCAALSQDASVVLRSEVALLEGLSFDLVVHTPYRALTGLMQDLADARASGSSDLDAAVASATPDAFREAMGKASGAVDALLLSDAPLLFPPGQIALAALRSGLRGKGLRLERYLAHLAQTALQQSGGTPSTSGAEAGEALLRQMNELDALGLAGMTAVDREEVAAIDKRARGWRNPLRDPGSAASKKASAASEADLAVKRDAKRTAKRVAQAAHEAELLGMPQTSAAGAVAGQVA